MERIPKKTFEFIFKRELTQVEQAAFDSWIPTYNGDFMRWSINHEILIPYEVYESFVRHQEDNFLLEKLRE